MVLYIVPKKGNQLPHALLETQQGTEGARVTQTDQAYISKYRI